MPETLSEILPTKLPLSTRVQLAVLDIYSNSPNPLTDEQLRAIFANHQLSYDNDGIQECLKLVQAVHARLHEEVAQL